MSNETYTPAYTAGSSPDNPLPVTNGGTGTTSGTLSKLQKLVASSQGSNLISNAANSANATITSPASAPSTTGYTNVMGGTTGYVTSVSGNVVAGSNVVTGLSSTTGLIAGQWAVESGTSFAFPTHIQPGTQIVSINTAASSMVLSKPAILSASGTFRIVNNLINFIGGVPFDFSNNLVLGGVQITSASPAYAGTISVIEFMTDAANFTAATILVKLFQNSSTPNSFRVAIDGVYNAITPAAYGASEWISIVFPALTLSGPHRVRIELSPNIAIQQVWVPTGARIWQFNAPIPTRLSFFGDSYMYAGLSGAWSCNALASRVANALGCFYDVNSQAGTGYIANGSVNYPWSAPQRTNNVAYRNYDAIVVLGSVNDNGQTAAAIQVAALTTYQGLRLNAPNAPIFIFGVPTTVTVSASTALILESGQIAAFNQWGDKNAWYFPITGDPNGAWIDANNIGTYIGSDNTHLTDVQGTSFVADKMTQSIKGVLQTVQY